MPYHILVTKQGRLLNGKTRSHYRAANIRIFSFAAFAHARLYK